MLLHAQPSRQTELRITGVPLSSTVTQPTQFDAGSIALGTTNFEVDLTTTQGAARFGTRWTDVLVVCAAPCPVNVANLQWRRADQGTWTSLSTTATRVELRQATINGSNDPWSNTVFWQYVLDWATSPPTALQDFPIVWQLNITEFQPVP